MMRIIIARRIILAVAGTILFSLLAAASNAQEAVTENAKPVTPPQGTITGRVVSSGGEPLSGAIVYLSTIGTPSTPRSTTVDAGGGFKLDGLDAGVFSVWAGAPGFISEAPPTPGQARRLYRAGDSLTLTLTKGGVITGTVTTSTNTPVVNAAVRAFRLRDGNGQPLPGIEGPRERFTDDRGVYRIYGLQAGSYVVSVGGSARFTSFIPNQYENDAPTYAPSSTRDTASEILVRGGEEATADIQYRGEPGHSISGTVAGVFPTQSTIYTGANIMLTDVRSRTILMTATASPFNNYGFAFYGVGDGEYELFAQRYQPPPVDSSASEGRRVKVQGADLSGINLNVTPLASIAGRLVLESNPPADCVKGRSTASQETVINVRRQVPETKVPETKVPETKVPARPTTKAQMGTTEVPLSFVNQSADAVFDARGDFILRNLHAGSYRIDWELPGAGWFLRSIAIGSPNMAAKVPDPKVTRDGITLKAGERVSGLTVTITEGAGGLRGRISVAEGQRVPPGLRVYLVPAEREAAEDVLRFFDTAADRDAGFAIGHIAPGRYWIIARPADDGDPTKVKPIRQDSALRAKVLREAEAVKKEVSLQRCERAADYDLPYTLRVPLKP